MALKVVTTVEVPHELTYYIPGFVRIAEMRQIAEDGLCEFVIVYDDTKLQEITEVSISDSDRPAESGGTDLGFIHVSDGARFFIVERNRPVTSPPKTGLRSMVVTGNAGWLGLNFHIQGFLRVEHFEQLESDRVLIHIVYDPAKTGEIHQLQFSDVDKTPDATPAPTTVGRVYRKSTGWGYLRYFDTIVSPHATEN